MKDRRYVLLTVVVVSIIYLFANFHRLSLNVLSASITADMGLGTRDMGLMSSVFFYSYAVMQIPCGLFADRKSPRVLIFAACLVTALATIIFACSDSFAVMCVARLFTGAATALIYIPALSAIRMSSSESNIGLLTGILVCAGQVGAACSSVPLLLLDRLIGWRTTLVTIGILMLVAAVPAWILLPGAKAERPGIETVGTAGATDLKKSRSITLLATLSLWFFITCGTKTSFQGSFGSDFFIHGKIVGDELAGRYMLLLSVGGIAGAFIYGKLCDMYGAFRMLLDSSLFIAGCWGILAVCGDTAYFLMGIVMLIIGIFSAGSVTAIFCCIDKISANRARGIAAGIVNCAAFLGTAVITQFNSLVMDILPLGTSREKYGALMLIFFLTCLLSTAAAFFCFKKKRLL